MGDKDDNPRRSAADDGDFAAKAEEDLGRLGRDARDAAASLVNSEMETPTGALSEIVIVQPIPPSAARFAEMFAAVSMMLPVTLFWTFASAGVWHPPTADETTQSVVPPATGLNLTRSAKADIHSSVTGSVPIGRPF